MSLSKLTQIMMEYYSDVRFSEHSIKAYTYARGIAEGEGLSDDDKLILCSAAILHDIGIPPAIKIHGSSKGEYQEAEGAKLVPEILEKAGMDGITEQVTWLVGNHHTHELAKDNLLLQILMEADYLVNLAEGKANDEKIREVLDGFFVTETGKGYLMGLFGVDVIH